MFQKAMQETKAVIWRFPLPALLSLLFYLSVLAQINELAELGTGLIIFFYGYFWFITAKLFLESRGWQSAKFQIASVVVFLPIAWWLMVPSEIIAPYLFFFAGLFLSIFVAPFVTRQASAAQLWAYLYRLSKNIGFSVIAAVILFLGIVAILGSLLFLLDIRTPDQVYLHVWLIIAALFAPILTLAGIPFRFDLTEENLPNGLRMILSYILVPLLLAYAAILYVYAIKIIFDWELPKGGVAYLVTGFSCAGIFVYHASFPLYRDPGVIGFFNRHFFKILLVPLSLFAIGLVVRINEYGITEPRYAISLCLVWLVAAAAFELFVSREQAPKFIFVSLVFLLIAASAGPWSAVNVSGWSQTGRLKALLEKNQLLVNDHIHLSTSEISLDDRLNISSIVDNITGSGQTSRIKPWFSGIANAHLNSNFSEIDEAPRFSAETIVEDMGIKYVSRSDRYKLAYDDDRGTEARSVRFSIGDSGNRPYLDVAGYDHLVNLYNYPVDEKGFTRNVTVANSGIELTVSYESQTSHYVVVLNQDEKLVFPLGELIRDARSGSSDESTKNAEPIIIDKESRHFSVRLLATEIRGVIPVETEIPVVKSIRSTLLIKRK